MIRTIEPSAHSGGSHGLHRTVILSAQGFRVSRVTGSALEPTVRTISLEPNENILVLSVHGGMLYRSKSQEQVGLLSAKSALFAVSLKGLMCFYTRGDHHWIELEWHSEKASGLNDWVEETTGHNGQPTLAAKSLLGSRAVSEGRIAQFLDSLDQDWETCQTGVMSFGHEVVGALVAEPRNGLLTSIPSEANKVLRHLMEEVRRDPAAAWPLKEASQMAGYSAFHLSRSFRSLIGFGFPEYVDRCRTELAVRILLDTDEMVDDIAKVCGFGSTQALRSACREYTGLLPSEFRQLPQSRIVTSSS
jgi:AraC-like DNA-binding protein